VATSCSAALKSAAAATLISRSADSARGSDTPETNARRAIKLREIRCLIVEEHLHVFARKINQKPMKIVQARC
jgi:hypothetical protein